MSLERKLNLKDDESLLSVVRESTVTKIAPAVLAIMLLLLPMFFLVPMLRLLTLGYILMGLSWFLGFFFGLRGLIKWRRSLLAITEKRLIIVKQGGFFDRHVIDVPYARILKVGYRIKGPLATIFHYGDLQVDPVAEGAPITLRHLPHPSQVQDLITELQGGGTGTRDDFGEILQSVSKMDSRKLGLLKSEIERTMRLLPQTEEL
jgi:hypothetical protein